MFFVYREDLDRSALNLPLIFLVDIGHDCVFVRHDT